MNIEEKQIDHILLSLADPRGGALLVLDPQQDPILLFSHTFLPKSAHIGGQAPQTAQCPPMGNPGSPTGYLSSKSQT